MGPRADLTAIIQHGAYNPYLGVLATGVAAALWFLFVEVVGIEWAVVALLPPFMQQPLNRERKRCFAIVSRRSEFPRMISAAYPAGDMMGSPATSSGSSIGGHPSREDLPLSSSASSATTANGSPQAPQQQRQQQSPEAQPFLPSGTLGGQGDGHDELAGEGGEESSSDDDAELEAARRFLGQLKSRCAGMVNALFAVGLSLAAIWDPALRYNPIFGVSSSWFVCASFICGYFVWDLYTILRRWGTDGDGWQWLVHCVISGGSLMSPFFATVAPLSWYGALMVFLEASTPFMSFRWLAIKAKTLLPPAEQVNAQWWIDAASLMFAVTFFGVRIVWAPAVLFVPLLRHLLLGDLVGVLSPVKRYTYAGLICTFYGLNLFWMAGIVRAALRRDGKSKKAPPEKTK